MTKQQIVAGIIDRLEADLVLFTAAERRLFIGPQVGGMKLADAAGEIVVITPDSPLGQQLFGLTAGDELQGLEAGKRTAYTVVSVV